MKYLLIDRIIKVVCNKELTAVKCVGLTEDYFSEHFPGYPVMPGALQIESIAQAATALIEISCDYKHKAILLMVEKAKFRKIVQPGEQLNIFVEIKLKKTDSVLIEGSITSGDRRVMECRMIMGLGNVDVFYPLKTRNLIETLYDQWLINAEIIK
jgi:3-hydroxyacyl-[acyl-carrier-protein] dehydratase